MANRTLSNDCAVAEGLPTIARVCRRHGYRTGYIGKWHLENNRDPFVPHHRRQGFEYWAVHNCSHDYFDSFYCGDTPERIPLPGYEPVGQTELACSFIREHAHEPFCLFLSWGPPHDPYVAPQAYMDRFPAEAQALSANVPDSAEVHRLLDTDPSSIGSSAERVRARWRETYEDDASLRQVVQGYRAHTAALDECMGRLLETLDRTELAEDTILVFSSDHGDMLGSHRMASKQMPYEESIAIPFLVRAPRWIPAGTVTEALLSPVDIMPTLLGLAGVPAPPDLDGLDLTDAVTGGRDDQQDAVLIMKLVPGGNPWLANGVTPWRGVRTRRYTYARLLDRGPWVLFDNLEDPLQLRNLVDDPGHREIRDQLDRRTDELLERAGDPNDTELLTELLRERKREQV
jgi:arylsulfatase A-like enzyme